MEKISDVFKTLDEIILLVEGRRVVFTNGCFDIIHEGHIRLFEFAKALGDCLVVGINSDSSVKALKGDLRPINKQENRAVVVASIRFVDYCFIFNEHNPISSIERLRPLIHVKGGDYKIEDLPEAETVYRYGGRVEIFPFYKDFSTTNILKRIKSC
ncbi:MAG TPA: D-glycero-beta-D-manno-heptose 1-phosphate adenylyltransferase [Thermodesulfobium narugense]|uniref:D-glycero-beta-D-manno-heptose 1-phosphate adenylyltransferase n=1 Tax=Thermodesulfobium acidiphilum TaxID=1794699 RepID=A0A2R4W1E2_THEAF|nr:D-glycero-beta-D-manno-heptose 1-phosphate adenylyltransferase [Thermodesulfobium acidiphilum]AWB10609.1 glycerol-3-phosphate cytidylyltransferase [Thermodesulfobium acidiphilum]HEM56371.1 D-glycero-beta-D-manno-heptose 1-phosphate adenylyltransferase [Thermodesulfobium narugense]